MDERVGVKKVRVYRYLSWLIMGMGFLFASLTYKYWNENLAFVPIIIMLIIYLPIVFLHRCPNCETYLDIRKDIGSYDYCPHCGIRYDRAS